MTKRAGVFFLVFPIRSSLELRSFLSLAPLRSVRCFLWLSRETGAWLRTRGVAISFRKDDGERKDEEGDRPQFPTLSLSLSKPRPLAKKKKKQASFYLRPAPRLPARRHPPRRRALHGVPAVGIRQREPAGLLGGARRKQEQRRRRRRRRRRRDKRRRRRRRERRRAPRTWSRRLPLRLRSPRSGHRSRRKWRKWRKGTREAAHGGRRPGRRLALARRRRPHGRARRAQDDGLRARPRDGGPAARVRDGRGGL